MIAPQGQRPPQGLEIGEKLLFLFEETHDVTKPTRCVNFLPAGPWFSGEFPSWSLLSFLSGSFYPFPFLWDYFYPYPVLNFYNKQGFFSKIKQTYIKVKLKKSDGQTNIEKYRVAANIKISYFVTDYRVTLIFTRYLTAKEIITESFNSTIGQF